MRTREKPCHNLSKLKNFTCYYQEYDEETREVGNINSGQNYWQVYKTVDQSGIQAKYYGLLSDYDGTGYYTDFGRYEINL